MMKKVWNFSAGPALLPQEVLLQAQAELLDWQGLGVSVMEISHRSSEFEALVNQAKQDLRALLNLPDTFEILFTAGGAQAQFALVPMNVLQATDRADYLITGTWSELAAREASRFADVHVVADGAPQHYQTIPAESSWQLDPSAQYLHYASNETIHGIQLHDMPKLNVPLVIDMSSDFLSKPLSFEGVELIYAGAQKNVGPAGLTVIIIKRACLLRCTTRAPRVFNYLTLSQCDSMPNTPPTYSWYLASLVFQWLKRQGGLTVMAERNQRKAALLYAAIDESALYVNSIDKRYRSLMNVVFDLREDKLLPVFLAEAKAQGLIGLKGHRLRGGVRASIYNAMPEEGVAALIEFMKNFERRYDTHSNHHH